MMPMGVLLGLVCTTVFTNLYLHFKYKRFCDRVLAERRQMREREADLNCDVLVATGLDKDIEYARNDEPINDTEAKQTK
ncbi:hypothetical protein AGDE_14066 [Angomonas deanei]|uniref:Uncharacterized protein n=1 Tax=Angomonas deanei TaxID=59799 RepID=A0A7G2CRH7_9TRYP|nr:hypothetical protein AGDE_14066 [Angomonas deanei]CAD2220782.1 hypothetical protein, conserved [Angomonas deanei]|eukprot:EPY21442.1 hypothetical protein AGDE_14066 [Angomonas deanei]